MERLWKQFDRIVVFDTETTGIEFGVDRIIEIGAVALERGEERGSFNCLIRLPEGETLPPFITDLTGITDRQLLAEGVEPEIAVDSFCRLLEGPGSCLLVAYNAQFDLKFPLSPAASLRSGVRPESPPLSGRPHRLPGPAGLPPQALQRH